MTAVVLQPKPTWWYCPACGNAQCTREAAPHTRFHPCPSLKGVLAPMIPQGIKAKVEVRLREDYVGDEIVRTDDDGRPVMSVVTTRDDGQDCAVFAPTAHADGRA